MILGAATALGCTSFDGLSLAGSTRAVGSCVSVVPPTRAVLASSLDQKLAVTFAIKTEDMGESDGGVPGYPAIGYDLDGLCTHGSTNRDCVAPDWRTLDASDGLGGRDNALGRAFYDLQRAGLGSVTEQSVSNITQGILTFVIRVGDYNGLSDDAQVSVAIYSATMKPRVNSVQVHPIREKPEWDGNDEWYAYTGWVDSGTDAGASLSDVAPPLFEDSNAYVNSGTMVARFRSLLAGSGLPLSNAIVTARLVPDGDGWVLGDGVIAGRIPIDALLAVGEATPGLLGGSQLCTTSAGYAEYKASQCSRADILEDDSEGHAAPCDAASVAWRFTAQPAKLVGTSEPEPAVSCDSGTSPSTDHCGSQGNR